MKKILLFAAATVVAIAASAAPLNNQRQGKAQSQRVIPALKQVKMDAAAIPAYQANPGQLRYASERNLGNKLSSEAIKMSNIKMARTLNSVTAPRKAPRKAGAVQNEYNGHGQYKDGDNYIDTTWVMRTATGEDEMTGEPIDFLVDVIPNCFDVENGVPAEYSLVAGTLTIPAQAVLSYTDKEDNQLHTIFLFSGETTNGNIDITVNEDGTLTTARGEQILYGDFLGEVFDPEFGDTYQGYWEIINNVKYLLPGQIPTPEVEYEPAGMYLHMGISPSGYRYTNNLAMIPAFGTQSFTGYCEDMVDNFSWTMNSLTTDEATGEDVVGETLTGNELNFSINTKNGVYTPPVFSASFQTATSNPYQWGLMGVDDSGQPNYEAAYVYAGQTGDSFQMSDGTYSQITKCNPDFDIAYYGFIGTPDVNTNGYSMSSLILYQGKPEAPLFITGVTYMVRQLTMKEDFNLKCKLVKVSRDPKTLRISLGDVIAEADIDPADVFVDESLGQLVWDEFYVEDEFGSTQSVDHLFIEDEFAVVIEGWDNGTFSCSPFGEYNCNVNGTTSTYLTQTGDEAIYGFFSLYNRQYIGFIDASYGYLKADAPTAIEVPAKGGDFKVAHIEPMLCSIDNETEERVTRLFLEEDEDMPEWFEIGVANEEYTEDSYGFDLVVSVEALPEGTETRSGSMTIWQEGAKLTVTVYQGEGAGVNGVKATVSKDGKIYTISGIQNNKAKGIVVRDGKKFIAK